MNGELARRSSVGVGDETEHGMGLFFVDIVAGIGVFAGGGSAGIGTGIDESECAANADQTNAVVVLLQRRNDLLGVFHAPSLGDHANLIYLTFGSILYTFNIFFKKFFNVTHQ